ncbi:MAG: Ni/Fe hydrogenase subunit alpha [Desulfovibrionales bacterium]
MSRQIAIDPITRIEGHASVTIDVDDDNHISGALFRVMDFRGFETFLQGMQVEMMPTMTARICGTCPVTHHVAASRAVDKVFGATIPESAEAMRNILNLGALISSHAVHFFALAGPDLLLGLDADPAERNIIGMVKKHPAMSKSALRLRTIGQNIVELVGGRGTHPVASVPGGMAAPLSKEKLQKLKDLVAEGMNLGQKLYTAAASILGTKKELMHSLPLETNYLGTVSDGVLDFYKGDMRFKKIDGTSLDVPEDNWASHISEQAVGHSYGKYVLFDAAGESLSYRVGPLARLNCADSIDTPLANAELEKFRHQFGAICHETAAYHSARMIELLHALEKLQKLVSSDALKSDTVKSQLGSPRNATAHVEAPRGILIHDYQVDGDGIVTRANLLVATQQNLEAIDSTIKMSAERYIDQPDNLLLNAVEFGIRCYDPCLSCATHRMGEMKLEVVIRRNGKFIRRARR